MVTTLELAKLTKNPFSLVPVNRVTIWAGYDSIKNELIDIVESCRSDRVGLSEFVILHGDYGAGKSHALRYLRYWITEEVNVDFKSAVVYLETLKVAATMSFVALYKKIIQELMPHIRDTAEWLYLAIEESVRQSNPDLRLQEQQQAIDLKYKDEDITPTFPPLSLLLKGVRENSDEALSLLLGNALTGQRPIARYQAYNMTGSIETEFDAVRCLGAYVNLCTRGTSALSAGDVLAQNKAFYFFFDELETMQDFKPAEALSLNQGIRDLINACPENCCFLFGMSGDARLTFALLTEPVMRRMSRDPIEIPPLDTNSAAEFLRQVLKLYRTDPTDPDEYPFRAEALVEISERTQRKTAADLFRGCRRVLERAVLEERLQLGGWIEKTDVDELL